MLPWKNSWFQIAFFAWIVSGALLVVDYAPKPNTGWLQAFHRAPKQPSEAPAKPSPPSEQQPPVKAPAPAQKAPVPAPEEPATKAPSPNPSAPSAKEEAVAKEAKGRKFLTAKNYNAALQLLTEACDAGAANACVTEAAMYGNGRGATKDEVKMRSLLQKACDGGAEFGCYNLALGDITRGDVKTALSVFAKSCDEGSTNNCLYGYQVSLSDFPGVHVPKDTARAFEFAKKGCQRGWPVFCRSLGDLYRDNTGDLRGETMLVSPDRVQAIAFYRKACVGYSGGNDPIACLNLKQMNATDKGIAHDYAEALTINREQCVANAMYCKDLGIMYENGLGVPTDLNKAIALYTKACDAASRTGCAALKRLGK